MLLSYNTYLKKIWMLSVFMLFINSMYPWFGWGNKLFIITYAFTFIISICFIFLCHQTFLSFKRISFLLLLAGAILWGVRNRNINGMIELLFLFGILSSLILSKDSLKEELLNFITKWFSLLLSVSLLVFILFICGFSIVSPTYIQYVDGRYPSLNFYFFLISVDIIDIVYRFKSVFMEPGHLTMGLVPLIMANRFNIRNKYVLILFIVELFTLSLAGYLTMILGYLLFNMSYKRLKLLLGGIIFIGLAIEGIKLSGNEEILNKYIWNRLEYTDGNIAGNNRTTVEFDIVYNNVINNPYLSWFGDDGVDITAFGGISGYKKFVVTDGLIGVYLIVALYLCLFFIYKRSDILFLSIILLLLLFQNAYPFWACIIIMYILGCYHLKRNIYS